jgi:hypothetical protein
VANSEISALSRELEFEHGGLIAEQILSGAYASAVADKHPTFPRDLRIKLSTISNFQ